MKTFNALFREKLSDKNFRRLFEEECHVCRNTMRVFALLEERQTNMEELARKLSIDIDELMRLKEAEYCNPRLVVKLCRHLKIDAPTSCKRLP